MIAEMESYFTALNMNFSLNLCEHFTTDEDKIKEHSSGSRFDRFHVITVEEFS